MARGATKKGRSKKSVVKLSPAEIEARRVKLDHKKMLRSVFVDAGFIRIPDMEDKEFSFDGQNTDFDDIFVYENVLVVCERTASISSNISQHLKPKKIVYDKIQSKKDEFVEFYTGLSADLRSALGEYEASDVVVKIVYASRYSIDEMHKINVPNPVYFDYPVLRYFKSTVDCIKHSARHELLEFLEVDASELGAGGVVGVAPASNTYVGSLLPEGSSNFAPGYKVVSFYVDPSSLLQRAYVLRRDGWRDSYSLYQRMLVKAKVDSIRKYLKNQKRVFVNNIIATLPEDTKILDGSGNTVDPATITKTKQVKIQIPLRHGSVGLVDGQHRTFAYHEASNDADIAPLRKKQNLLLTGVIYPAGTTATEREIFEARLFLEINSNQTGAKSNLKQAIGLVLEPFAAESVAARVLDGLDKSSGPLAAQVERYFYDVDKLKPTSIISYALKPLVKLSGDGTLFQLWTDPRKENIIADADHGALDDYVRFCVSEINAILIGFKIGAGGHRWTTDKAVEGRLLTTTFVNAFLITLRLLIAAPKRYTQEEYVQKLKQFSDFDTAGYHSSQYRRMAEEIVSKYFS